MKRTQKLSAYRPVVAILLALNLALLLLLPAALWADEGATPGVVISPDESVVVNQPADEAAPLVEDAAPPAADETQPVEDIEADDSASPTEPGEVANLENVADVQSQTIEDNAIEATDAPTFTLTGPETITVGQPMELTLTISNPPEGTWSQVNGLILGVDFIFRSGFSDPWDTMMHYQESLMYYGLSEKLYGETLVLEPRLGAYQLFDTWGIQVKSVQLVDPPADMPAMGTHEFSTAPLTDAVITIELTVPIIFHDKTIQFSFSEDQGTHEDDAQEGFWQGAEATVSIPTQSIVGTSTLKSAKLTAEKAFEFTFSVPVDGFDQTNTIMLINGKYIVDTDWKLEFFRDSSWEAYSETSSLQPLSTEFRMRLTPPKGATVGSYTYAIGNAWQPAVIPYDPEYTEFIPLTTGTFQVQLASTDDSSNTNTNKTSTTSSSSLAKTGDNTLSLAMISLILLLDGCAVLYYRRRILPNIT